MRVGLDTSPLVQTQAGTARYVRGLLAHNDYERLSWGGSRRAATVARAARSKSRLSDGVRGTRLRPRRAQNASTREATSCRQSPSA